MTIILHTESDLSEDALARTTVRNVQGTTCRCKFMYVVYALADVHRDGCVSFIDDNTGARHTTHDTPSTLIGKTQTRQEMTESWFN